LASSPTTPVTNPNASRAGLGYNLRFGFGVSPRWSIVLSADGAQAYFDGASVSETAWTIGPQVFITRQLYARAGIGAATYEQTRGIAPATTTGQRAILALAAVAAIGFEFMQHYHSSLALEAVGHHRLLPQQRQSQHVRIKLRAQSVLVSRGAAQTVP
jgi:hypothetical protein